jgi:hypothetical protein
MQRPLAWRLWELARVVLPAGTYAFGGPSAHLAVFHNLFVTKLHWLSEQVTRAVSRDDSVAQLRWCLEQVAVRPVSQDKSEPSHNSTVRVTMESVCLTQEFMDLLALGMTLPGPTSTEFAIAIGCYRAGVVRAGGCSCFGISRHC